MLPFLYLCHGLMVCGAEGLWFRGGFTVKVEGLGLRSSNFGVIRGRRTG